jgi:hypothetical protein
MMDLKSHFADAVSYWERKRVIYNGVMLGPGMA